MRFCFAVGNAVTLVHFRLDREIFSMKDPVSRRIIGPLMGAVSLVGILSSGCAHVSKPEVNPPAKMNVILISIDALRADALDMYNQDSAGLSPNIDRLAQKGVVFENAFSNAYFTTPSHMTMLTGQLPKTHLVLQPASPPLASRINLAEISSPHGYTSTWLGGRGHMNLNPWLGFNRGFTKFLTPELSDNYDFDKQLKDAQGHAPFFLFLHLWTPHSPYISPPMYAKKFMPKEYSGKLSANRDEFFGRVRAYNFTQSNPESLAHKLKGGFYANEFWREMFYTDRASEAYWSLVRVGDGFDQDLDFLKSAYRASVNWTDDLIGRMLADIDKSGLAQNTIVVLTSDHGEEFFEHGNFFHQTAHRENLHIPLIIFIPGRENLAGRRVVQVAQSADIVPTVLSALGISSTEHFDGKNLMGLIDGSKTSEIHPYIISYTALTGAKMSIQTLDWKIIWTDREGCEVYNLRADLGEHHNLCAPGAPKAAEVIKLKRELSALAGKIIK